MSFQQLGLSEALLTAIADQGYTAPTPVQQKAIPAIIQGRDIIAAAQTGTGKTAGFTLPILQRLSEKPVDKRCVRVLILTPTRELAAQVHESVQTYGKHLPFKATPVFGGVAINPQISRLRKGSEIVIATPGRLLDLVNQRAINLSNVEMLVLDEADRMLDMGFIHDIKRVLKLLPPQRQNLLFSATFSSEIKQLASGLLNNPESIEVAPQNATAERVSQLIHPVDRSRKAELLSFLIGSKNWQQVLVFTRTKHGANRLVTQLERDGLTSAAIHGNKSQGARTRALADFKNGKVRVLIATDIAARGLDIVKLPYVVNFDLPNISEDYVHRIGRTGRAENEGLATSLVCIDEKDLLRDIERLLKCKLPQEVLPGFEPDPTIPAEPIKMGGGKRQSSPRSKPQRRNRAGSEKSRDERRSSDKPRSSKPGRSRAGSEQSRDERRFSDKPRSSKPGRSRAGSEQSRDERRSSDKPRSSKPGRSRSGSDQSRDERRFSDKPRSSKPGRSRSGSDQSRDERRFSDKPRSSKPGRPGKPGRSRAGSDQSRDERRFSDKPRSSKPGRSRSGSEQSRDERRFSDKPRSSKPGKPGRSRSGSDQSRDERRFSDKPRSSKPGRPGKPSKPGRSRSGSDQSRDERRFSDKPRSSKPGKPGRSRSGSDQSRDERRFSDKPRSSKPGRSRPAADKSRSAKPAKSGKPGAKARTGRSKPIKLNVSRPKGQRSKRK